ncbi:hypothetical protein HZU77_009770 [Neisseriaceae bacterium TC5R-5]|nr:hypothetical protein [Neisseriaceae bacterium TC5R-5]
MATQSLGAAAPLLRFYPKVSPFSELATQVINNYRLHEEADDAIRAYLSGCIEGELAFALNAHQHSAVTTVYRCQQALLSRLGLTGELNPEQQRLKGWLVGLLDSLTEALDEVSTAEGEP